MNRDQSEYYNHLGSFSPYCFLNGNGDIVTETSISEIFSHSGEPQSIDSIAIAEILNKRFMLGDRTIAPGIFRTPWMAKWDTKSRSWDLYNVPPHKEDSANVKSLSERLFDLLCEEVRGYIGSAKRIGILLSGGMDSRMVAGVLNKLIETKQVEVESVTAYTWGKPESRDVVYSREIARRLGWNWKHYTVSASDLWENFRMAGIRGCEYSGIHLHAIPQICRDIDDEILLVGSYGDSIGRAEYSGVHVENLVPVSNGFRNFAGLLKQRLYNSLRNRWSEDIEPYHGRFNEEKRYMLDELDQQLHYMRRMLNPCMELLHEVVPTYQVFTAPPVFQFMWSFRPECRNNEIYSHMMELFPDSLADIPWARTGLTYGKTEGEPDSYTKHHDSYEKYIQNELLDDISDRILSGRIKALGLFNMTAIEQLLHMVKKYPGHNSDYLERITWLVSLDFYLESHPGIKPADIRGTFTDLISARVLTPARYLLLRLYRKFRY